MRRFIAAVTDGLTDLLCMAAMHPTETREYGRDTKITVRACACCKIFEITKGIFDDE